MDTSRLKQLALKIQHERDLEKGLEVAKKRQRGMLPVLPKVPGFDIYAIYIPASKVSGDFYDFIPVAENLIGFALGDVSGHGIEAGIIMGMAKKALQIYAKGKPSPKETLCVTNADLAKDLDCETFVSASYGILDTQRRVFRFARAGHNPPYLVNPARNPQLTEIKPNGMVLGVDKSGMRFPVVMQEVEIVLQPGDLVFQYTDGVVEAMDKHKMEFGEQRLKDLLIKNYCLSMLDLVHLAEESLESHIGTKEHEDDWTMIGFKVL